MDSNSPNAPKLETSDVPGLGRRRVLRSFTVLVPVLLMAASWAWLVRDAEARLRSDFRALEKTNDALMSGNANEAAAWRSYYAQLRALDHTLGIRSALKPWSHGENQRLLGELYDALGEIAPGRLVSIEARLKKGPLPKNERDVLEAIHVFAQQIGDQDLRRQTAALLKASRPDRQRRERRGGMRPR